MTKDLMSRLVEAEADLARSVPAADDAVGVRVRAAAGRRRRNRHVREVVGGLVVAAVVGSGSWAVAGTMSTPVVPVSTSPPTVTPTATTEPSPSPAVEQPRPTAAPAPAPEPERTGPPVRQQTIDDATVIARLREPRTGEEWTTPERAPEMDEVLSHELAPMHAWRVGSRGDATIYTVVDGSAPDDVMNGAAVQGVYEVGPDGIRAIACPSARSTDPCFDWNTVAADVPRDEDTFYDTLTLPTQVDVGDGWLLTTTATTSSPWFSQRLVIDGQVLYGTAGRVQTVADLGAIQVVEIVRDGAVPGLDDRRYALRLPIGGTITLAADDSPSGQFRNIRWDDGVVRDLLGDDNGWRWQSTAPGSGVCFSGTFSVEARHVDADWRAAGTTPGGHRVYVPLPGNATAAAVRSWHAEQSWTVTDDGEYVTGAEAGYPYSSDAAFVADHAVYAIQGPDGTWQLRLRVDAVQIVYECS